MSRHSFKYPAPGEEHPSIAQYWAEAIDFAGKVDFDYTDLSQSDVSERVVIPCGGTHGTWWGATNQPLVAISDRKAHV